MKRFLLTVTFLLLACLTRADGDAPAASMPKDVTLTSGRVLRNVQVIRWNKDSVVLKYSGGVDPIPFSLFKIPAPADLAAIRAGRESGAKPAAAAPSGTGRTLAGQVSSALRGTAQIKFPGVAVTAYDYAQWNDASAREKAALPANFAAMTSVQREAAVTNAWKEALKDTPALAQATTDGDGNFSLSLPANADVFLVCSGTRRNGRIFEAVNWVVHPEPSATHVDLNDSQHGQ